MGRKRNSEKLLNENLLNLYSKVIGSAVVENFYRQVYSNVI